MMLSNFLKWGWGNPAAPADEEDNRFKWEELPDLVKLECFKHLDRQTLNNLRQISASSRELIEHCHGIHVILPARVYSPTKLWTMVNSTKMASKKTIPDSTINHILSQMEGKKITALKMYEMPPSIGQTFPFERFVQFPTWLQDVTLKYVDIQLVHNVFRQCTNLTTFQYKTGHLRPLPHGPLAYALLLASFSPVPVPAVNEKLIEKIASFPPPPSNATQLYKLPRLKNMHLTIDAMTFNFKSDWGNVIFMLVALPVVPPLTKFKFQFDPKTILSWKTHLLILSCLGEFLSKTPNLQIFQYCSTFGKLLLDREEHEWMQMLRGLTNRFGTDRLKEIAEATIGPAPMRTFIVLVRRILNAAARLLINLRELDVQLKQENEHDLFTSFMGSLQSPVLTSCKISGFCSKVSPANHADGMTIQKFFLLSRQRQPENFAIYRSVTELSVSIGRTLSLALDLNLWLDGYTILSKTLANLPNLKVLNLKQYLVKQYDAWSEFHALNKIFGTTAAAVQDTSIFSKLEKLYLENFYIRGLVPRMLIYCKNLKEFYFKHPDIRYYSNNGISSAQLLTVLTSLPKLEKVYAQPIYPLWYYQEVCATRQFQLVEFNIPGRVLESLEMSLRHRQALTSIGEMKRLSDVSDDVDALEDNILDLPLGKYEFTFSSEQ